MTYQKIKHDLYYLQCLSEFAEAAWKAHPLAASTLLNWDKFYKEIEDVCSDIVRKCGEANE